MSFVLERLLAEEEIGVEKAFSLVSGNQSIKDIMSRNVHHWTGRLLAEPKFGHVIIIAGIVKPQPIKVSIDFADKDNATPSIHDNIVLHISIRFNERQIVRSSHFPGVGWSDEQISDNLINKSLKNPVLPCQPFSIRLTILQATFQVHVNDESYCTYDYSQMGGGSASTVGAEKQIKVVRVSHDFDRITRFDHRQLFPNVFPIQIDYTEWIEDLDSDDEEVKHHFVFLSDVPEAFTVGDSVELHGLVAGSQSAEFGVDLYGSDSVRVVMRLHVRFAKKTVARNAMHPDFRFYKEAEERIGVFPFKRGNRFVIGLQVTRESFLIFINGEYYTYFNHRQPANVAVAIVKVWCSTKTELTISRVDYQKKQPLSLSYIMPAACCSLDSDYSK